jgi:1-acyl-sn-glycerol-3-phosphate acyltransferase
MGKAELSNIPLFGIFFRTLDIVVERGNEEKSAGAYRKAAKYLDNGSNLVIFPEGGIFAEPLKIKPFKDGAVKLAARKEKAILPVGLPDNYKIIPDESKLVKPGKIRIILHRPLRASGKSTEEIFRVKNELYDIIQKDILA